MSQEVQPSPATSNAPIVTLPSSASAGHVTEAPAAAAAHRTGQAGQPPDCHTSEIRFERPILHGPATGSRPTPARWNQSSWSRQVPDLPPRRPGLDPPRRGPPVSGGPGAQQGGASAPHAAGAPRCPRPARPRPAGQATDPHRPEMHLRCTWHRPQANRRRHRAQASAATTSARPILPESGRSSTTGLSRRMVTTGELRTVEYATSGGGIIAV